MQATAPMQAAAAQVTIERGIVHLIRNKAFFGHLLASMERRRDSSCPASMAVEVHAAGVRLLYDPERFHSDGIPWSVEWLAAVLEHECRHVILDHATRRGDREARKWQIACDLAINQDLSGLPPGHLHPDQYDLPTGLGAEAFYAKLPDQDEEQQGAPGAPGEDPAPDVAPQGNGDGNGPGEGGQGDSRPSGDMCSGAAWADKPGGVAERCVRNLVEQAIEAAKGDAPAEAKRLVERVDEEAADYAFFLRRFCHGLQRRGHRTTRLRAHRRYGDLFPGRKPRRRGRVAVLVDTSGSIGAAQLSMFWAELKSIAAQVDTIVVECDAKIHAVYELGPHDDEPTFHGGGGTVFHDVFTALGGGVGGLRTERHVMEQAAALLQGCEGLVALTDGAASVPTRDPGLPVLWALTMDRTPPAGYGERLLVT